MIQINYVKDITLCIRANCTNPHIPRGKYCQLHRSKPRKRCVETVCKKSGRCCIHEKCNTRPSFNLPTETKALYCSEHKLPNMINVKDKRCIHENCNTRPTFNLPTETKAL